jgi:hypothetical protein
MRYVIQQNDGRVRETDNKVEARFWAWLSMAYHLCNVYLAAGAPTPLWPSDIR